MPNDAFDPVKIAGQLLRKLRMSLVVSSITNSNYEGQITGPEDWVKILAPLAATVEDADGSKMTYGDTLSADDAVLAMDHKKRFGFLAKDIDNAARAADVFADETFQEVLKAAQEYVLGKYAEADAGNQITFDEAGGDDIEEKIADAGENLDENEVPDAGRFIVLPPHEVRLIEDKISDRGTALGDDVVRAGYQGQFRGFEVYKAPSSHFTETGTSPSYRHALYGWRGAITYADAIVQVESGRHSDYIADFVRGLHVAGAKTLPGRDVALGDLRIRTDSGS